MAPNIRIFKRDAEVETTEQRNSSFRANQPHHADTTTTTTTEVPGKFYHYVCSGDLLKFNENRDIPFENRMFKN